MNHEPLSLALAARAARLRAILRGLGGAVMAMSGGVEEILHEPGLRQYRVRCYGDLARIEVEPAEMPAPVHRAIEVVERIRMVAGFRHVTLNLAGCRCGSLNRGRDLTIAPEPARRG
ncbi:MAG: hypothetical protein ACUVS4_12185 [Chloroflexaceae bacterium]